MKIVRGEGLAFAIFINSLMFMGFLGTGDTSFLWVILFNIVWTSIQIIINKKKAEEEISRMMLLERYRREESAAKRANAITDLYMSAQPPDMLRRTYIRYLVYRRLYSVLCCDESELDELYKFNKFYKGRFMDYEMWQKLALMIKKEKESGVKDKGRHRRNYYYREMKGLYDLLVHSVVFCNNYDFLFNFTKNLKNEFANYLIDGNFGPFSENFIKTMHNIFPVETDFVNDYYFIMDLVVSDVVDKFCDE